MSEKRSLILKGVRCNYPAFFTLPVINGEAAKNYGCKLILHKQDNAKQIVEINNEMARIVKETSFFNGHMPPESKRCLTEPDLSKYPYLDGSLVLSGNSRVPVIVVAADGKSIIRSQEQCPVFSGCYINAKVSLWAQNHPQYGRRINCSLLSVQFAKTGEPYGAGFSEEERLSGYEQEEGDQDTWS